MPNMSLQWTEQLQAIRKFYTTGVTLPYSFRKEQLKKLKSAILRHQNELHEALYTDLKKSPEESWITETGFVVSEINFALKKLGGWMHSQRLRTNLVNLPSSSRVIREPLGVVLIIAPWNYPLQLLVTPLVGAIAAGNCAVVKPSEFAPATSAIMKKIIEENFSSGYILFAEGDGAKVIPDMVENFRFDYIFYTGSNAVGKIIYKMAAEQLVPVTLELGGKSPCVVESDAHLVIAAKRITMTKFANAGQMCVAPDYVLVHSSVRDKFIGQMKECIVRFFSEDPSSSYNYCKIINEKQFRRLIDYLKDGVVVHGGRYNLDKLYLEPTLIEDVASGASIMKEEIFGPILPIIPFDDFDEAAAVIDQNPNPLAFYIYTSSVEKENRWLQRVPAGGSCVNNSSWHLTNYHLPFGGRGNSGFGEYHGRHSFETFSHRKAVLKSPTWFDPSIKYPPFKGKLWLFKKIVK